MTGPEGHDGPRGNREIEMACLGSMILSEAAADEIIALLGEECWYFDSHRRLFRHIRDMRQADLAMDPQVLIDRVRHSGDLEWIGGIEAIVQIAEFVPSPANSASYAAQVREWWVRREVEALGKKAFDPENSIDALKLEAEKIITGAEAAQAPRSGLLASFASETAVKSVCSGFQVIDGHGCGGFPCGQMSLVMAGSNVGKSAQMIRMALESSRIEGPTLYATFADLNGAQIHARMMKQLCGWSKRPREPHLQAAYDEALAEIRKLPITVYDATELRSGRNVETFVSWISAQKTKFKSAWVDYAQELRTSKRVRSDLGVAEECSDALRWWAMRNQETAVIVGSQITLGNKREGTSDMPKGGKVWWERSGVVLKITLVEDPEKEGPAEYRSIRGLAVAHCEKNRFGHEKPKNWWRFNENRGCFDEL